jgi:hypothetical protein
MYRINFLNLIKFFLIASLIGCNEITYFPREYPRVRTKPVEYTYQFEVLHGEIIFIGDSKVTDHGFVWHLTPNFEVDISQKISLGVATDIGDFEYKADDEFMTDEIYYIRAYVQSDTHTVYGTELMFSGK